MRKVTGKPNLIKLVNKNMILELLERSDPISRADIAKRTKISAPTVSSIVDELIKEGLAVEVGEGDSSGGRKPTLVTFNASSHFVIGIELKSESVLIVETDLRGNILLEQTFKWDGNILSIAELSRIIQLFLKETKGQQSGNLKGIGIAIPGVTDRDKGYVKEATQLGWARVPIVDELGKYFSLPIIADNDVNMATLGEHWLGSGRNSDDLVFISIGHGIGAGILLKGELFRGSSSSSGEIGYMIVSPQTLYQLQEGYGPLESHFGVRAIENKLAQMKVERRESFLTEAIHHLVYAIVNVISIINPTKVILDLRGMFEEKIHTFQLLIEQYSPSSIVVECSSLGKYSTVLGAVYSVIRSQQSSVSFRNE